MAIRAQLAHRVLSHKMSLKVNTTVVQAVLLVPVWLVQVTVVMERLGTGVGKLQRMQQLNWLHRQLHKVVLVCPHCRSEHIDNGVYSMFNHQWHQC